MGVEEQVVLCIWHQTSITQNTGGVPLVIIRITKNITCVMSEFDAFTDLRLG